MVDRTILVQDSVNGGMHQSCMDQHQLKHEPSLRDSQATFTTLRRVVPADFVSFVPSRRHDYEGTMATTSGASSTITSIMSLFRAVDAIVL